MKLKVHSVENCFTIEWISQGGIIDLSTAEWGESEALHMNRLILLAGSIKAFPHRSFMLHHRKVRNVFKSPEMGEGDLKWE